MASLTLALIAFVASATAATTGRAAIGSGVCAVKNGRYPLGGQCDAYIECVDGVPEERLCPDGLLFNDQLGPHAFPCQYPIDVTCVARAGLQPAQPTERCPHQYAYYRNGDSRNCGKFVNCANGVAFDFECPEGLAWSKDSYRCDWPDQVEDCDAEAFLGFTCPNSARHLESLGLGPQEEDGKFYRSTADCVHYFTCLSGKPRMFRCGDDQAFSEATNQCEDISNVTGCAVPDQSYKRQPVVSVPTFQQPLRRG